MGYHNSDFKPYSQLVRNSCPMRMLLRLTSCALPLLGLIAASWLTTGCLRSRRDTLQDEYIRNEIPRRTLAQKKMELAQEGKRLNEKAEKLLKELDKDTRDQLEEIDLLKKGEK